jgi:hypothetical protein
MEKGMRKPPDLVMFKRPESKTANAEGTANAEHAKAVTMQLDRSCLLDLFAQGLRRSALTDP